MAPEAESSPLRILLVRHAESQANAGGVLQGQSVDPALSPEGVEQARLLGRRLKAYGPVVIVSSPLRRARETAEHASRECHVPLLVRSELAELSWGRLEGKPKTDRIRDALVALMDRWDSGDDSGAVEGGESLAQAKARLRSLVLDLARSHAGATVVLVGHGQINKVLLHLLTGDAFRRLNLLGQANGALNILRVDLTQERQRALLVNDLSHLAVRPPRRDEGDVLSSV